MPETTHLVDGKVTSKEHFEQVTKNASAPTLSIEQRVERLELAVFPHFAVNPAVEAIPERPQEGQTERDAKITSLEAQVAQLVKLLTPTGTGAVTQPAAETAT